MALLLTGSVSTFRDEPPTRKGYLELVLKMSENASKGVLALGLCSHNVSEFEQRNEDALHCAIPTDSRGSLPPSKAMGAWLPTYFENAYAENP